MSETSPLEIPGYQVQGLIGKGGMGRVYRAEQLATRRAVAIKLLTTGGVDEARLGAFRREAATLGKLEHPHIVPLYDFGERDGVPYLVVRFLSGGTVADRLRDGPVEIGTALGWVADVADALEAAHRQGVIHRDVKPSNLLLDQAGNVYLGDFGIAATAVDLREASHSGSAAYASPEQARGETLDARTDIYSLAATAFEMLTGRKPYEADTALGMMVRHMNDPVPSARAALPSLPAEMDAALASGMAKAPGERPRSAGDFAQNLRRGAETQVVDEPTAATATAVAAKPAHSPSRKWVIATGLAGGVLCLATLGILGGGLADRFLSPAATATTPRREPTPASAVTAAPLAQTLPLEDDFSDPSSGFASVQDRDGQVGYADGELRIRVLPGVEWYSPFQGLEEQDLVISVQARQFFGPSLSELGVVCRWQDEGNYLAAALRLDGMVSLWKKVEGEVQRLQDWTPVELASGGADYYTLQLTCQGSRVSFAVDGIQVAAVLDPSPASGTLALMAGLLEEGELTAAFDSLRVTRP